MTPDLQALSRAYHLRILKLDLWDVSRYQCVNRWSDCMWFSHYVPESSSAFSLHIVAVWLQRSRLKYASVKIENSKRVMKFYYSDVFCCQHRPLISKKSWDEWWYSILWHIGSSMLPCKSCSCSLTTNHTHVTQLFFSFFVHKCFSSSDLWPWQSL